MKYLLSNKFKKPGWVLFSIGVILGIIFSFNDYESKLLTTKVISIFHFGIISNDGLIKIIENSIVDELISILIIIGALLVGFSKEKIEDEYISKIRLESLALAILTNSFILLFATIFLYDLSYINVLIYNLFTPLLIFLLLFNYAVYKTKKS